MKTLLLAALVGALALAAPGVEARQFRAADTQSADYPTVLALEHFGRLVRERTNGRHAVTVFHSRQLGEERETIEQTRVGAIDINRVNVAPLADLIPAVNVLSLPFMFRDTAHLHAVMDGPVGQSILDLFAPHGFVGLAFLDSGARSIYNALRPVRTLDDLRGLRIRVQQSELMVEMVRALGAIPIALPYGQVGTGLATRLIDGAENNWPSYVTTGHSSAARNLTLTEHTMSPEVMIMSARAWAALDDADRKVIRDAAREAALAMRSVWRAWEDRARREAIGAGVTVVERFDREAFERAVAPLVERTLRDPVLGDLANAIRAVR